MPSRRITVEDPTHGGMRVDRYVSDVLSLFSRSQAKVRHLTAVVNDRPVKLSHRLRAGDRLDIHYDEPEPTGVEPEAIDLCVLYEDDRVIVVDKPVGMVVHPAKGNYSGTLVQGLMHRISKLSSRFDEATRPGVVHRLDKDTSGVIIAAKDPDAQAFLSSQFETRSTHKKYLAIVKGRVSTPNGRIEGHIGRDPHHRKRFAVTGDRGKWSATTFRVLSRFDDYSFLALEPETGRTHQLRVHLQHLGHPILGDPVYARRDGRFPDCGLMLHAYLLEIGLPPTGVRRRFRAPLPERFKNVLVALS